MSMDYSGLGTIREMMLWLDGSILQEREINVSDFVKSHCWIRIEWIVWKCFGDWSWSRNDFPILSFGKFQINRRNSLKFG
jgi:hypothetical protein